MQLSSKVSQKSYLSNAVSSNFFMLLSGNLGIYMGKKWKKKKKLYGFSYGYIKYSKCWSVYPSLFLKTDIFAQSDII